MRMAWGLSPTSLTESKPLDSQEQTPGLSPKSCLLRPTLFLPIRALTWAPTKAESLVAGDVGYTVGTWERRTKVADGTVKVTHGQYLTVWQKQKDGTWQATFDTGSTAP